MIWYFMIAAFWAIAILYCCGLVIGIVTFKKKDATITMLEREMEDLPVNTQLDSEKLERYLEAS